jgi:hypothetical protein
MLAVSRYDPSYVAVCRGKMDRLLAAYAALGKSGPVEAFEAEFTRNMVMALDDYFLHRQRSTEGKDGNPLNEVRMLCNAIKGDGVFDRENTIKYDPVRSVLGLKFGDEVRLSVDDFARLALAFLAEIEVRFS